MTAWRAADNAATSKVSGRQYKRRRRIEFLDVMNRVAAERPGREIHVIPRLRGGRGSQFTSASFTGLAAMRRMDGKGARRDQVLK